MIETKEITVNIGVKMPRTFMHISDAHVAIYNEARTKFWTPGSGVLPKDSFRELLGYADESKLDCVFLTGDAIDYMDDKNIAFLEKTFTETKTDILYAYGNHEGLCETGKYYSKYINLMGDTPDFIVRDYGDFLVAAVDDSDVSVTPSQVEKLRNLLTRGLPVILIMHIPVSNEDMTPWIEEHWGGDFRIGKDTDSESTKEFCNLIKSEPLIKAVFAGHIHYGLEGRLNENANEYTVAPAFLEVCNIIHVI